MGPLYRNIFGADSHTSAKEELPPVLEDQFLFFNKWLLKTGLTVHLRVVLGWFESGSMVSARIPGEELVELTMKLQQS